MSKQIDMIMDSYTLYLRNRNLSELTIKNYTSTLTRFISFLEQRNFSTKVEDVTLDHIEIFLASLKHPATYSKGGKEYKHKKANMALEATTRSAILAPIRSFFKWALKHKHITSNPAELIELPKKGKRVPKTVSAKGVNKLIDETNESYFPERDRFIIAMMVLLGPRANEMATMKIGQINMEEELVHIFGKGDKERKLPISKNLLPIVTEYLKVREEELKKHGNVDEDRVLITYRGAKALSKRGLQYIITNLAKKAGVTTISGNQVSAHKLRHTFATELYNNNSKADILLLALLLGHSDPNSTKIYTQVSSDVLRDVLNTPIYNSSVTNEDGEDIDKEIRL